MLAQRVITAAAGIPIIIALILIGGIPYSIAVGVILVLAVLEFYAATDPENAEGSPARPHIRQTHPFWVQRLPGYVGAAAIALVVLGAHHGFDYWTGAFAGGLGLIFLALILRGDAATGLRDFLWSASGFAYIGFLGAHLIFLRDLDDDGKWVLLAVFATFIADTFAYFVGRTIGRVRIAPAVSPNKTVEGTLAGFAGGLAAVLVLNWALDLDVATWKMAILGAILPAFALVGDLAESLIKRGVGVKDTSELVPGHGGFLDRADAILFTTPLVYYFVIWVVL